MLRDTTASHPGCVLFHQYWPEFSTSRDGCVRNTGSRKGDPFVCVPLGIRIEGLSLQARENLQFDAFDPLTGKVVRSAEMKIGETVTLPAVAGGLILTGRISASEKR